MDDAARKVEEELLGQLIAHVRMGHLTDSQVSAAMFLLERLALQRVLRPLAEPGFTEWPATFH